MESTDIGLGFIFGVFAMAIAMGWLITPEISKITVQEDIDKILKAQEDCKIKEYYYMDTHRQFCDKIGVKP